MKDEFRKIYFLMNLDTKGLLYAPVCGDNFSVRMKILSRGV